MMMIALAQGQEVGPIKDITSLEFPSKDDIMMGHM